MHHTDVLRELMILNDMTIVETAKRLGKSHTSVVHNLQSRDISFENLIEILGEMDYELVIRRKREGNLPDDEYALRRADYENQEAEQ